MLKPRLIICLLVLAGIAAVAILLARYFRPSAEPALESVDAPDSTGKQSEPYRGLNGNSFLAENGLPGSNAAQDLKLVGRVVDGMQVIFKELATRHIATNEQLSGFFIGADGIPYSEDDLILHS